MARQHFVIAVLGGIFIYLFIYYVRKENQDFWNTEVKTNLPQVGGVTNTNKRGAVHNTHTHTYMYIVQYS